MRQYLANHTDVVLCVSALVRLEVLVKHLIDQNMSLVADYETFLREQQWLAVGDKIFDMALQLRVCHQIKVSDALHLAISLLLFIMLVLKSGQTMID